MMLEARIAEYREEVRRLLDDNMEDSVWEMVEAIADEFGFWDNDNKMEEVRKQLLTIA